MLTVLHYTFKVTNKYKGDNMGFLLSMIVLAVGTTMGFISDLISAYTERNLDAKTQG